MAEYQFHVQHLQQIHSKVFFVEFKFIHFTVVFNDPAETGWSAEKHVHFPFALFCKLAE